MKSLKRHALEIVATVWLAVVAVQFLASYFITWMRLDLTPVYVVMLGLLIVITGIRVLRSVHSHDGKR